MGMAAIVSGQTDFFFSDPSALPQVRSGKLRALAVASLKRSGQLPDTPTVSESGLPGYEYTNWYGFLVPKKTPRPIVQRLFKEITAVLNSPDVREKLINGGVTPMGGTPDEFAAFVRTDYARWGKIVKDSGVKLE